MPSTVLRRGLSNTAVESGQVLYAHRWFIGAIFGYFFCGVVAVQVYQLPENMPVLVYSALIPWATLIFFGVFAFVYPVYVMVFVRPHQLTRYMIEDLRDNYLSPERLLGAVIMIALLPMMISVYATFKTMIPVTNPYGFDAAFADWDRLLHGGHHPWELLHSVLGFRLITSLIDFFYYLWVFVLYGTLFWQCFSTRDPRLRMQFFLSCVVTWSVLGSLLATLLSSGGPVYYGALTGLEDPYRTLMDYLYAANEVAPLSALQIQESLWQSHMMNRYDFGKGISAMPSMHVATTVLMALLGWRVHRYVGIALTAFATLILIGSVHLGWHYAIDGYVSIVLTCLIWRAAGWWVERDRAFQAA